jgi:putative oxidoreductase
MEKFSSFAQLYLRIAISSAYLAFGLDRLGVWGNPGDKNISWGDWEHFMKYATEVMSFLPTNVVVLFAIIATIAEISFGVLLLLGKWTRVAAFGSAVLAFFFAISMSISFGIISPLSYSVFTVSAASFLLASCKNYKWSLDNLVNNYKLRYERI